MSLSRVRQHLLQTLALTAVLLGNHALHGQTLKQPVAPVRNVTDTYFGQKIDDPYRWLEDQKSAESKQWMRGQADFAPRQT